MLRAAEVGISVNDLELLSIGMVLDMFAEKINDLESDEGSGEAREATQHDIDNF